MLTPYNVEYQYYMDLELLETIYLKMKYSKLGFTLLCVCIVAFLFPLLTSQISSSKESDTIGW